MDYGTKRIGVSVSDELYITAQGLDSIERKDLKSDFDRINSIVTEYGVSEIIMGLPLNMDGSYSQKTKEVVSFMSKLTNAINVPVKTWDERLTSVQAERALLEADMSRGKRKKLSDRLAAQFILQSYLDSRKRETNA